MLAKSYTFKSKVWLYPGHAGWHFINVPKVQTADIKKNFHPHRRGFGSQKVVATIGTTTWKTSIFPDSKSGTYLMGLKAVVRKKENIKMGNTVKCTIEIEI